MTERKGITWGELKAFAAQHNLPDDATVIGELWDDQHTENDQRPVGSAGVHLYLNGSAELILHVE